MPRRYFHRSDTNLSSIVACLRKLGLRVHVANSEYDLVVQYGGMTMLAEVRPEGEARKAREGRQERFHEDFMIYWLQSAEDCQELSKTLRRWVSAIRKDVMVDLNQGGQLS